MKIYISADIEGCTGISSFSQCGAASGTYFDYPFARRRMTEDLNAVIRGLRRRGVAEIVIKDGHGNCKNLLIDELDGDVDLITGQGSVTDGMMDGIDASFDGAILFGYHAMAGASKALMEHALVGGLQRFWINGEPAGEILTNAAAAGFYDVPTILVVADQAGAMEARQRLTGTTAVATKEGFGKYMGKLNTLDKDLELIEEAAYTCCSQTPLPGPIKFYGQVEMRASFRTSEEAECAAILSGIRRCNASTVSWRSPDFQRAHRLALDVFRLSMQGRRSGD